MAKKKTTKPTTTPEEPKEMEIDETVTETEAGAETPPSVNTPVPKIVRAGGPGKTDPIKKKTPMWVWLVVGLVLVAGASVAGYLYWSKPAGNTNTAVINSDSTAGQLTARLIDGVLVPENESNPLLNAVMIENLTASRPPSGLDKASLVYEALAEGGITRFLAIFPNTAKISEIGPVRSARPYYIDWASEYKAMYVHVGGSPQALTTLKAGKANVYDLNQFYHSPNFWRDRSRPAPHNLYTSSNLLALAWPSVAKNAVQPKFDSWSYDDEPGLDARPETVKDITLDFSSFGYKVSYAYDRGQNLYRRSVGGKAHVTRDGTQITAKNIIVQLTQAGLIPKESERLQMTTVGTGKLLVFSGGETVVGTWKKDSVTARTQLLDETGQDIVLARGTTWVEIIPPDRAVTY